MEKMEEMLLIWIKDMIHKRFPLRTEIIREQAKHFHSYVLKEDINLSNECFMASKGWFEKFKTRFSLHSVSFSGEKASPDNEAAQKFIPELKDLIARKGYVLDQIFNCDETGLNWKKMPSRTFLTKEEREAPGFKVAKERLTLLFYANVSGSFRCKPMLV